MQLIAVLLILVVAAAAGYFYARDTGKPDEEVTTVTRKARSWTGTAKSWTGTARGKAESWTGTAKDWLRIGKSKKEAEQLRTWVANLSGVNEAFTTWLEGLSPEEAKKFTKEIANFGASLNVDRDWLLSGQVDDDLELRKGIENAVASYCMAYWRALKVRDDAVAFATFQAWQKAPSRKKHRELGQKLFVKMADDGLVSVPAELYLAPEKERRAYVVQAISDFAQKDRLAFNAIFKQVVSASTEEPVPTEEAPAPTSGRKRKPKGEAAPALASTTA